jgi:GAF domain-containing protein
LREQQQRALGELDAINRRLSGEAWAQHFGRLPGGIQQASYARSGQTLAEQTWLPEVELAVTEKKPVARSQPQDQAASSPFQAAMAAPIVLHGEVIGALQVGEAGRPRPWSADDLAFIQAVAGQVALAVENARLLDQTRRAAQREKVIAEAADKIHRPIDLDAVLRAALEEVSRVTGSHEVSIQLGVGTADGNGRANGDGHVPDAAGGGNG